MPSNTARPNAQILRSRGIGSGVGTLIGAGWLGYGLSLFPNGVRVSLDLLGLGIIVFLLNGSRRLLVASRQLPGPDAAEQAVGRRVWRWFGLNFLVEILLLNVAVNLLAQPSLHVYWIPAISFVVGLHFLPMALLFEAPSYWFCGGAMIGGASLATVGLRVGTLPSVIIGTEAIINASILWTTAGWGMARMMVRRLDNH